MGEVKVKICGITNLDDALLAVRMGADALGFNFYERSSRYIDPDEAKEIINQVGESVLKVGVFVNESLNRILAIEKAANLNALQLHGDETKEFVQELKAKTDSHVIKVFRVGPGFNAESLNDDFGADSILLDTFSEVEYGGTGHAFNWNIAREIGERFPKTYIAGGLDRSNISSAILSAKPFGVDACSCLESSPGKKDKIKLINFLSIAKYQLPEVVKEYSIEKNHPIYRFVRSLDLFDLLAVFRSQPTLYFPRASITQLCSFIYGYMSAASDLEDIKGKEYIQFFRQFYKWAGIRTGSFNTFILSGIDYTLDLSHQDETQAFELYFALMEEFKKDEGIKY